MNVFYTDSDPKIAARNLDSTRLPKMVLESAQLLCNHISSSPYKKSHDKVSLSRWVGHTRANFIWVADHGIACAEEHVWRGGKIHKSLEVVLMAREKANEIPPGDFTAPVQIMSPDCRFACCDFCVLDQVRDCPGGAEAAIKAYRKYYCNYKNTVKLPGNKIVPSDWGKREKPFWYEVKQSSVEDLD